MPFFPDTSLPGFVLALTKPKPRYFRQYRNPGQDASGKNGTYGHPNIYIYIYVYMCVCVYVCM